ncbi:hypothetical protein HUJ04_001803 [Dendroctonus ponderosae]|nr:hypothetical protein HUJ04_001803 [Dendroctonus ponderosae]
MDSKQFGNGKSVKARVRLSPYGHNVFTRLNDLVVEEAAAEKVHHHHVSKHDKKLLWWAIPIVLLIKLYFVTVGLHTVLFGVIVLKLLVFKGALWLPYLAYEVKRVCLQEGLLKEVWNGLWQKKLDVAQNLEYFPVADGYNETWVPTS